MHGTGYEDEHGEVTQKNERGYYLLGDGIYKDGGVPEKFRGMLLTASPPTRTPAWSRGNQGDIYAGGCHKTGGTGPWHHARPPPRAGPRRTGKKNDPLTLDELRGMRGKWVWVVSPDKDLTVSAWAYVGANHVFTYWEYDNDELVGRVVYNLCDYGAWIAYRNPIKTVMPGEEQHGV